MEQEQPAHPFVSDNCVICYEKITEIDTMTFPCKHLCSHVTCFVKSVIATGRFICPICRHNLVENLPEPPIQAIPMSVDIIEAGEVAGAVSLIINGIRIPIGPIPHVLELRGNMYDGDDLPPLEDIPLPPPSPPPVYHQRRISVQCRATTLSGRRCRKRTKEESGYCYSHRTLP